MNAFVAPWLLWLLLANVAIAFVEWSYRVARYSTFLDALPYTIIPILIGQIGLFHGFRGASSLFVAAAVFTLCNVLLRVFVTYYIGETLNIANWCGVVLLVVAVLLLKVK